MQGTPYDAATTAVQVKMGEALYAAGERDAGVQVFQQVLQRDEEHAAALVAPVEMPRKTLFFFRLSALRWHSYGHGVPDPHSR